MVNPYQPPRHASKPPSLPKPEISRTRLAKEIRAFLNGQNSSDELEACCIDHLDSKDPVVLHVAETLQFVGYDFSDGFIQTDKQGWDYGQRLLLALESDCRVVHRYERTSRTHIVAAVSFLAFVVSLYFMGASELFFCSVFVPLGGLSLLLSYVRRKRAQCPEPYESTVYPFASFSDLAKAYHASGFRKQRYPAYLRLRCQRRKWRAIYEWMSWAIGYPLIGGMWLLFTPVVLLVQMWPSCESREVIVAN